MASCWVYGSHEDMLGIKQGVPDPLAAQLLSGKILWYVCLLNFFVFIVCMDFFTHVSMCHDAHVEVREELAGVSFLLPTM